MNKIKNYINGNISGLSEKEQNVFNPSTGEVISKVILSNSDDFISCVNNSVESQKEWEIQTPLKRSRVISKYKNIIEKNIEYLEKIE